MESARIGQATLRYEVTGTGEPVVFIHGALIASTFRPLVEEVGPAAGHRLLLYNRRGYSGSRPADDAVDIADHAADCLALMNSIGVERAHVVGHSYGGSVALQLALDAPRAVRSLVLLEPALMTGEMAQSYRDALQRGVEHYRQSTTSEVVDAFLRARWPNYATPLESALPGAFKQAVVDAPIWFEREVFSMLDWQFGEIEARRIEQPALLILGSESEALMARIGDAHRLLLTWLPHAEEMVIQDVNHFMLVQAPRALALTLKEFWSRQPL